MGRISVSLIKFPGPAPAGSSSEVTVAKAPATSRPGRPPPPPLLVPADLKRAPWPRESSSRNSAPRGSPRRPPPARGGSSLPSGKVSHENSVNHPLRCENCCVSVFTCCFPPMQRSTRGMRGGTGTSSTSATRTRLRSSHSPMLRSTLK